MRQNRRDFAVAIRKRRPRSSVARLAAADRAAAAGRSGWSRNCGLRTQRLQPVPGKAQADFPADGRDPAQIGRNWAATAIAARRAELRKELCHLMRITLESPATLRRRIARIAALANAIRSRQTRPLRRQPAAGRLDRQALPQPRPELPRPDPGRQHGPDAGGRQVRVRPRLQVLHLRHLVDSPGDHPGHRRPEPHDPRAGAHDRDHEPRARRPPRPGPGERRRADARETAAAAGSPPTKPPACCG